MKPLIKQYQRDRNEIPPDIRKEKLDSLIKKFGLSSKRISELSGHSIQTVRCWRSDKNRRTITTDTLVNLYEYFGIDAYE